MATPRKTYVPHFLAAIFVSFIGIMVFVYVESRKANPIFLDEHGHVRGNGQEK